MDIDELTWEIFFLFFLSNEYYILILKNNYCFTLFNLIAGVAS